MQRKEVIMREEFRIGGAFIIGGLVGAVIALLYAPKSGKETRRDISRTVGKVKKEAAEIIGETIESVNRFARDVKERAEDIIEKGAELSEEAKKEIIDTLEEGQKTLDKQRKRIMKALGI
jgi:gas vesicle protein